MLVSPSQEIALKVVGDPGVQTFKMALYNMREGLQITEYDAIVGEQVAKVLCGGEVDADVYGRSARRSDVGLARWLL